jgi:hypothetical protein
MPKWSTEGSRFEKIVMGMEPAGYQPFVILKGGISLTALLRRIESNFPYLMEQQTNTAHPCFTPRMGLIKQ